MNSTTHLGAFSDVQCGWSQKKYSNSEAITRLLINLDRPQIIVPLHNDSWSDTSLIDHSTKTQSNFTCEYINQKFSLSITK